jgi:beta-glucosidase
VSVEYAIDGAFATGTIKADLGIVVVGEKPYAEGWGDTENLSLDSGDLLTIERMRATNKRLVVIIVSGRPLIITDQLKKWDAVIAAWLPGSEGGGIADVLFGDTVFTGKLPLPWPNSIAQLPIAPDGTTKDGTQVLFPRYFGLRY